MKRKKKSLQKQEFEARRQMEQDAQRSTDARLKAIEAQYDNMVRRGR